MVRSVFTGPRRQPSFEWPPTTSRDELKSTKRLTEKLLRAVAPSNSAKPSKRVYIEKSDGSRRPLGIACLEDKIVQSAVREVLNCIYETDFVGFSVGFRRGRNAHQALDALAVGITDKRVNWVLDADIQGFFDAIDRDWLIKFLEHRIEDKRMLRLIRKWLNAGIIEDTNWSDSGYGTPQGSVISPLLANVFLH